MIIIIGILAAIAIPVYVSQRDKAKEAVLKNSARDVVTSVLTYSAADLDTTWEPTPALTNGTLSAYARTLRELRPRGEREARRRRGHQRRRVP